MLPLDHPDRIQITFDDHRLVANDLVNHLACRRLTELNNEVASGLRSAPSGWDPTMALLRERAFGHRNRGRDPAQVCGCGGLFRTPQLRHDNRSVLVGCIHRVILGGSAVGLCAACFRLHPRDISPRFGDCCSRAGIPVRGRPPGRHRCSSRRLKRKVCQHEWNNELVPELPAIVADLRNAA